MIHNSYYTPREDVARLAPERGGTINRYIRPRGVIIALLPVARWFTSVVNHNDVKKAINGPSY